MSVNFEDQVESYGAEIYAYLWRILRNKEDAEDCLQETFLRAYRAYDRLDDNSNHRAWFYKIATNVANTFFRKQARRVPRAIELHDEAMVVKTDEIWNTGERDKIEQVRSEVALLPHKQRAALILRKYQELEYQEIGLTLGCSENSARANVYQALKKLRVKFHEDDS